MKRDLPTAILVACLALGACGDDGNAGSDAASDTAADDSNVSGDALDDTSTELDAAGEDTALAPQDTTIGPPTAEVYCELMSEAFCDYYIRCDRMAVSSVEACRAVFVEACNAKFEPTYIALEAVGLVELSVPGVTQCTAHLRTVTCEQQLRDLDGDCGALWEGAVPAGGACGIGPTGIETLVCAPGTKCVLGLDFCGTCAATVAVGEACGDGVRCADTARCVDSVCVARSRPGEACGDDQPCVQGSACDAGVCAGPNIAGLGELCGAGVSCQYKSVCRGGICTATALIGEACVDDAGCASGFCQADVCTPLLVEGDTCSRATQCSTWRCAGTCQSAIDSCLQQ